MSEHQKKNEDKLPEESKISDLENQKYNKQLNLFVHSLENWFGFAHQQANHYY